MPHQNGAGGRDTAGMTSHIRASIHKRLSGKPTIRRKKDLSTRSNLFHFRQSACMASIRFLFDKDKRAFLPRCTLRPQIHPATAEAGIRHPFSHFHRNGLSKKRMRHCRRMNPLQFLRSVPRSGKRSVRRMVRHSGSESE